MKVVIAPRLPSGDTRVRLGIPAVRNDRCTRQWASKTVTAVASPSVPRTRRQIPRPPAKATRSQVCGPRRRAAGAPSGAVATRP